MAEQKIIQKDKVLMPSQDYDFLRDKGLEYIQSLSGDIWSDHNLHDPGITTLEILSYALTDLGYRTGFSITDLLTEKNGKIAPPDKSGLFPAHEVLPTSPLTIFDYRKLLLKIEGVRNAWLKPLNNPSQPDDLRAAEVPIYVDCHEGQLSFNKTNKLGNTNQPLYLNGLYNVLLELEIDDQLGALTETQLTYRVKRGPLKGIVVSIDCEGVDFIDGTINFGSDLKIIKTVTTPKRTADNQFYADVTLSVSHDRSVSTQVLKKLSVLIIDDRPTPTAGSVTIKAANIKALLNDNSAGALVPLFWQKQQQRKKCIDNVRCVLHANRNQCEDYFSIQTIDSESVAFCADIEVRPEADLEEVQAKIFHATEIYFNPPIRYYTLKEMLQEGLCADEIFNGPYFDPNFRCNGDPVFTKPGFIKIEDLKKSELRRVLYVSDIINILMDFEEVIAVRNALLRKYDASGNPAATSEKWCLSITENHQPKFYKEKSKLLFFKNKLQYRVRTLEYLKTLEHLRALDRKAAYVDANQVIELPRGKYREPDRFFSIQHDYPKNFGIGKSGLPANATVRRVAQARQFKAYLTFYDQILANYLSQLANVHHLFSLDKNLKQTYFWHYLKDITGVLTKNKFEDEFYDQMPKPAAGSKERNPLIEDEELFEDRRNRVLDHLMARFAEQFNDYVWMMYSYTGERDKLGEELIDAKIEFLREYPLISRERCKAFNYHPERPGQVWDTANVSGLQKRVSRLLGIEDFSRRNLTCIEICVALFSVRQRGNKVRLEIKDNQNKVLFKSVELFRNKTEAFKESSKLCPFMRKQSSYKIDTDGGIGMITYRIVGGGVSIQHADSFNTELDAARSIRSLIDRYDEVLLTTEPCNREGFHLIEHILLRPFDNKDELMEICLDPGCNSCGDEDPYSFRITVLLPYWPKKFRELRYRRHIENIIRQETPAHIHARICWIDNWQLAEFEKSYRSWLEAKMNKSTSPAKLRTELKKLILVLKQLKSVYPAATLHDCVDDGDDNPVQLGNTNLGIFF
jgi:hypothetical protein